MKAFDNVVEVNVEIEGRKIYCEGIQNFRFYVGFDDKDFVDDFLENKIKNEVEEKLKAMGYDVFRDYWMDIKINWEICLSTF